MCSVRRSERALDRAWASAPPPENSVPFSTDIAHAANAWRRGSSTRSPERGSLTCGDRFRHNPCVRPLRSICSCRSAQPVVASATPVPARCGRSRKRSRRPSTPVTSTDPASMQSASGCRRTARRSGRLSRGVAPDSAHRHHSTGAPVPRRSSPPARRHRRIGVRSPAFRRAGPRRSPPERTPPGGP
jgi:hypothetical protein